MEPIKLSVHSLVELVLRCGDIDRRYSDDSAMFLGAQAHRRIQKSMGEEYQPEVSLKLTVPVDGQEVLLQGRADGLFWKDGLLYIDEIKTTVLPIEALRQKESMHLGQAECYAYLLLHTMDQPPDTIGVQLTYFQLDTEEIQRVRFTFSAEEVDAFFEDTLARYADFLRLERTFSALRNASIEQLPFPFPAYRKGQRELAAAVYRVIGKEKKLYAQAPTGIGKTLSSLFPAVKAIPGHNLDKLFYLTAKTVTRTVAEEAVSLMAQAGLRIKSVTLRAKDKICFCDQPNCNPVDCPYAKGHYDRINRALLELLQEHDLITPAVVEEAARAHRVCPYELSLDAALWADLVVCDYNHVFDPSVYLRRFFDREDDSRYVFLIDEAHNLTDRVRDMYSTVLRKAPFSHLSRQLRGREPAASALRKAMRQVNRYLIDLRAELDGRTEHAQTERDAVLGALVTLFVQAAEEWLALNQTEHPLYPELLELTFEASAFAGMAELYDEHFVTLVEDGEEGLQVTQFCLDPSEIIAQRLGWAVSSILFSATLTPLTYYRETLGGQKEDPILELPSPFDNRRLLLLAHEGISTKYRDRAASYRPVADAIQAATAPRQGNYLCFFPSYDYMRQVHTIFCEQYPEVETLLQESRMDEQQRLDFLARFDRDNPRTLIGFGVLGGIFSEGIDLKGERLIGSVIVGVGLPGLSLRQEQIREYFDWINGHGYDYAYVFPGMNKVMQAAGRVIRGEQDEGLVLLIDSRFGTMRYRSLYPGHWSHLQLLSSTDQIARHYERWREALVSDGDQSLK